LVFAGGEEGLINYLNPQSMSKNYLLPIALLIALTQSTFTLAQVSTVDSTRVRNELLQFSKVYFEAYNTCDVNKTLSLLSDDFEFYHDLVGYVVGKEAMRKMIEPICIKYNYDWIKARVIGNQNTFVLSENGKVYGAIMTGELLFYVIDKQSGKEVKESTSSFIWLLRYRENSWLISRDLSYNHQDISEK
jgi:ketosteroid isomerase-like protein